MVLGHPLGVFLADDGGDVGSVAFGFVGTEAGDGEELGDGSWSGVDEGVEGGVAEDDEGGLAGLGGFGFAPGAEVGFERFLGGGEDEIVCSLRGDAVFPLFCGFCGGS